MSVCSSRLQDPSTEVMSYDRKPYVVIYHLEEKSVVWGKPTTKQSSTSDFVSELDYVEILSVTLALVISTIDLVLYRLSPLSV
ncbi:hypothetical protein J6590_034804 [Homalodisca vitripennis]|nr:hypothetical protein J6590_034804 [Homalodisca vitripennis]